MMIVTCNGCSASFWRYNISKTRAANPQYCSQACRTRVDNARAVDRLQSRFWSRVAIGREEDCWEWTGRRDPNGYGRFDYEHKPQVAHRLVLTFLGINIGDLHACHTCDNPPCCNPNHLFLGTQADNMNDMDAKGRRVLPAVRIGRDVNTSRLTEEQVLEAFRSDEPAKAVAARFGVSSTAIALIRKGKNWAHLTGAQNV